MYVGIELGQSPTGTLSHRRKSLLAVWASNDTHHRTAIGLELFPKEILDLVVEHLVVNIGIPKAVLLCTAPCSPDGPITPIPQLKIVRSNEAVPNLREIIRSTRLLAFINTGAEGVMPQVEPSQHGSHTLTAFAYQSMQPI